MPELTRLIQKKTIPHALLIVDGKKRALKFAQELIGTTAEFHPDIHHIRPEGKYHPIAALRKLAEDVALTPFEAPYKVFLIHDAEKMLVASANALLKTFEEPTDYTVILLLTSYPDKLLPTILSRCQTYRFHESHIDNARFKPLLDALAGGTIPEIEDPDETCFEAIMNWYRDLYVYHMGINPKYLFYPERINDYAKLIPRPLDEVEYFIQKAQLGVERSLKFAPTMETIQKAVNRFNAIG